MKKTSAHKRIMLSRETLRNLDEYALRHAAWGLSGDTHNASCITELTCPGQSCRTCPTVASECC
jgi:hypothetical protein